MDDKDMTTVAADIPKEWADVIKKEAKKQMPPISRKAMIFKIIAAYVKKVQNKNKKWR